MSRHHSYLNSSVTILSAYKGEEPFASFIKKYFSQHKRFGSKDRKQVSHLCYCYFRLGKALPDAALEEKFLIALFICSAEPNEILQELKPDWNVTVTSSLKDKISFIGYPDFIQVIFPWQSELSEKVDKEKFTLSHLIQPDLFLRLRPGKEDGVKQKLYKAGIEFRSISPVCISLSNSSSIDKLVELDKEAVVQDYSSQRIKEFLSLIPNNNSLTVWDCCAASGGKSILAKDVLENINLTVSDVRESILINLKKRFHLSGIKNYKNFVADLSEPVTKGLNEKFNLIITDVPCSGSGTWSRTPEQLGYFNARKIDEYAALQKKIVSNVIPYILPGGYLLYITCSVFKKENEEVIAFINEKFHFEVIKMEILEGYTQKADTMFATLLKAIV